MRESGTEVGWWLQRMVILVFLVWGLDWRQPLLAGRDLQLGLTWLIWPVWLWYVGCSWEPL